MPKKKEYRDDDTEATGSDEPADSLEQAAPLNTIPEGITPQPAVEPTPARLEALPSPKIKGPLFPGFKEMPKLPVSVLADKHKTSAVLLAAVKAEYGWGDDTKLAEKDYLSELQKWLKAPAGQGRSI